MPQYLRSKPLKKQRSAHLTSLGGQLQKQASTKRVGLLRNLGRHLEPRLRLGRKVRVRQQRKPQAVDQNRVPKLIKLKIANLAREEATNRDRDHIGLDLKVGVSATLGKNARPVETVPQIDCHAEEQQETVSMEVEGKAGLLLNADQSEGSTAEVEAGK